ncbi:MAG: hypothetical protein HY554_11560 [Elusimicrobia bacterium]|nr:hypothetical protein [Elusimicrobiota bacterium]
MDTFSKTLARVRRESGYPTAYAFYHKNGGRRLFPFTYVHYLRFERAVSMPRPEWMPMLLFALRLPQHSTNLRELNLAFLRALLRTDEAHSAVLAPLLAAAKERDFSESAAARYRAGQTVHLSPAQFELVAADEATYWCSEVLLNDSASWTAEGIAEKTGMPLEKIRKALQNLVAAKLARASSKGRFKAREPGKLYSFPGRLPGMNGPLKRIEGYWEKMAKDRGGTVAWRMDLVRAPAARVAAYAGRLLEAVDSAADLSVKEQGDHTGFFFVRAEIRKVMPF